MLPSEKAGFEADIAIPLVRETNNKLFEATQRYPERLKGYAQLAMKDVSAAGEELKRCRNELGFVGLNVLSNYGDTQIDDERYFPILETAAQLDMFVFLHPAVPNIPQLHGRGGILCTKGAGFGIDVTIAVLRLIYSGIFDKLPNLKIILGHLGEGIPFFLGRMNDAYLKFPVFPQKSPLEYFRQNIWVASSGNFSPEAFACTRDVLGVERIVFASDFPYEEIGKTVDFVRSCSRSESEMEQYFHVNALKLSTEL